MTGATLDGGGGLEAQISAWRTWLRRRPALREADVAELEDHLRGQVEALGEAGLAEDEAFLVAVKRLGAVDALSREFAREHSERLWKQLVIGGGPEAGAGERREALVALALAVVAAALVKLPVLAGLTPERNPDFYARNASLAAFPLLAAFLAWKRGLARRTAGWLAAGFLAGAALVNGYPFTPRSDTGALAALHLPIALWLLVGVAYAGGRWGEVGRRMDFVRFSGELAVYVVLMALGGGVLAGFTMGIFQSIGANAAWFVEGWLLPCGAAGALLVAAWLVEAKQGVIENIAPVLARIFTPMVAAVLLAFLGTMAWTGRGIHLDRNLLIAFDLLLALVLGLLLYSLSARDPDAPPGAADWLLLGLVVSALLVDLLALGAMAVRLSDFGPTPNRLAALGENLLLLVNLAGSAWLALRFLRGRAPFRALEAWQVAYLPVFAAWAAAVVALFPVLFRFG